MVKDKEKKEEKVLTPFQQEVYDICRLYIEEMDKGIDAFFKKSMKYDYQGLHLKWTDEWYRLYCTINKVNSCDFYFCSDTTIATLSIKISPEKKVILKRTLMSLDSIGIKALLSYVKYQLGQLNNIRQEQNEKKEASFKKERLLVEELENLYKSS